MSNIGSFSRYCGPAAVSSALGITRKDAAERIMEARPAGRRSNGRTTYIDEIGRVVGKPVKVITKPDAAHRVSTGGNGRYARMGRSSDVHPTLTQWLRQNPGREAILRSSHHFVHVRDGECIETNGWEPRRGRVTHAVFLDA